MVPVTREGCPPGAAGNVPASQGYTAMPFEPLPYPRPGRRFGPPSSGMEKAARVQSDGVTATRPRNIPSLCVPPDEAAVVSCAFGARINPTQRPGWTYPTERLLTGADSDRCCSLKTLVHLAVWRLRPAFRATGFGARVELLPVTRMDACVAGTVDE